MPAKNPAMRRVFLECGIDSPHVIRTPFAHRTVTDVSNMTSIDELIQSHCQPRSPEDALDGATIDRLLAQLSGWERVKDNVAITRDFTFKNFRHTLGFINAVGFMANHEDHHPDIKAGYGHCRLTWSTHDAGGLSLNDFICAAKVEALLR